MTVKQELVQVLEIWKALQGFENNTLLWRESNKQICFALRFLKIVFDNLIKNVRSEILK